MLITAVCPACETRYQVQASLRGQPMRCPNAQCRKVFTVPAEEPPAPAAKPAPRPQPPAPGNGRRTGSVGELVPLVAAEIVEPPAPKADSAPSWREPPPVRRPTTTAPTPRPAPEPAPAPPAAKAAPREMPAGTWEPPPVRRGPAAAPPPTEEPIPPTPEPPIAVETPEPAAEEPVEHHVPAKRTGLIVVGGVLLVVILLGVGAGVVWFLMGGSEAYYASQAQTAYNTGQFSQAAGFYDQLQGNFPTSEKHDFYKLMKGLSDLRSQAAAPDPDTSGVLEQFDQFIADHNNKDQALLKDRAPDLGETIGRLADSFAQHNPSPTDDSPLKIADQLVNALAKTTELNPEVPSPELKARIEKDLSGVRTAVAHALHRQAAIARIKTAADVKPPAKKVRDVIHQVQKEELDEPGIGDLPEVKAIRDAVYSQHMTAVTYQAGGMDLPPPPHEIEETRFIINSPLPLNTAVGKAPPNDPVVLAAARGILYALKRTNGQVSWAVSVGVDATALPVRVPAAEGVPERILVVSAVSKDADALDALDADGNRLWRYLMGAKCLGRPLVIGNLAYLSAYDGKVHEIELAQGKLLGVYDLGQPLTVGGALDPATNLLYFPADDFCVYAIDPQRRQCVQILYTGHLAGSLHGAPLIVTPDPQLGDSWLVLNQTHGLDEMQLRVYALPIKDREEPPEKLDREPLVPGWTWFPPYHDGEKLAMLGDTGVLGLFGIRQARNPHDPPLFPMLPTNLDLGAAAGKARSRAEVVEVQGQDFWLLAGGELKRLFLGLDPATGPRLTPAARWQPRPLGSPLHASQTASYTRAEQDGAGIGTMLVLVTQPLAQQTCLATAVDDDRGDVLWQRQLGLVCQGELVELQSAAANGPPVLLALDQGGGLFAFDPARYANLKDGEWREGGQLLFEAMDDGPGAPPELLPGPDGRSAYEIASPGDGTHLVIRRIEATANGLATKEFTIPLPAPLAGTPAVTDTMMVLPLGGVDGVMGRLALPLDEKSTIAQGPSWRSRRAPPDARGRVTATGSDTFLAGDGARGLTHWQWPQPKLFHSLPAGKDTPTLARKEAGSLTADPILLPEVPTTPRQVCIAAVGGIVTILTVANEGGLKPGRSWDLGGPITAGPFVQVLPDGSTRIACVVSETQLVWLDPAKDGELWRHPAKPGAALVGRPRLVGGMVVVADESGRIVGLDPDTGKAGPEYLLQGSAAPAAAPVDFGADRLFVPLTDGTVLLPKLERIRPKS